MEGDGIQTGPVRKAYIDGCLLPKQVLTTIEHSIPESTGTRDSHRSIASAGKIEAVGSGVTALRAGERVVVFGPSSTYLQSTTSADESTVVHSDRIHLIPENYSAWQACSFAAALVIATALCKQELHFTFLPGQQRHAYGQDIEIPPGRRIAIIGGETDLAAALIQVLVRAAPRDTEIVFTATMASQEDLFQRVCHLVSLGASFGIDGSLPDLLDEADQFQDEAGIEVIINTAEGPVRPDLLQCLRGERKVVECHTLNLAQTTVDGFIGDATYSEAWYAMLVESATVFAQYIEPPDCCVSDEGSQGAETDENDH